MAVALAKPGDIFGWMNLSGSSAFQLDYTTKGHPKLVLLLGIEPSDVRLRIAEGVTPVKYVDHTIGQLIFDRENGPSIAARWTDHEAGDHQTIVALHSWAHMSLADPRSGALNNWALSIVDDAGQWIDLVTRSSQTMPRV